MIRRSFPKLAVLILPCCFLILQSCARGTDSPNKETLAGRWIGSAEMDGRQDFIILNLSVKDGQMQGTMDLLFDNEMGLKTTAIVLRDKEISFNVSRKEGDWSFKGKRQAGQMQGTANSGTKEGAFSLAAVADRDPASYDTYAGSYRLSPDRVISIAPYRGEMGCPYPVSVDFSDGRIRALFPAGQGRFFAGPAFLIPAPNEVNLSFERDGNGQVSALLWQEPGKPQQRAARIAYRQEAVEFNNGDVRLAGTLTLPSAPEPCPAVILIHGSGPQPRDHAVLKWIADYFVLNGVAVLAYDKRGVGGSTGNWNDASMEDLAGDALAGVSFLKSRPEIQPGKIGLWGISQGGWISVLAAARSSDIAFIILVSGAGVSVAQQDLDRIELTLRSSGLPESEAQAAVAHQRLFFDTLNGKAGWDEFEASIKRARETSWSGYVALPTKERFDLRAPVVRRFFSYDPGPDLERLSCPVLALFGGRDIIVPPDRNVAPMEQALKRGGRADYTIRVFPSADHVLQETPTGAMRDLPFVKRLVPDYLETMITWLKKLLA
jgi:pimeloyl-ACP methyl ester carboxylesterase